MTSDAVGTSSSCVPLTLPVLVENEDNYLIAQWLVAEGEEIEQGELVVSIETAKARQDLEAPATGVLHAQVPAGAEVEAGTAVAMVSPSGRCAVCSAVR
ncbi:lipoyl domain-containing protein [Kribbella sp. NPDC051587]|uniref:lipoyl domain-containing protein n=1 Tax=Kribbella sp. NPDC051587 TaxID=3364119 RepID=UPI0037AE90BE